MKTLKTSPMASILVSPVTRKDFDSAQIQLRQRRSAAAVDMGAVADLLRRLAKAVVSIRLHRDVVVVAVVVPVDALEGEDRQRRAEDEERCRLDAPGKADHRARRHAVARIGSPGRPELHIGERIRDVLDVVRVELV